VLPCLVGGKNPAIENGFHRRSADPDVINAWWAEADYNLGIVPCDMGLVAVDLDLTKRGGVDRAILDMLPATRTHRTPSGGEHRLYLSFEAFSNKGLDVNVDVRSANGYILWPPSVINDVEYRVVDDREPEMLPEKVRVHLGRKQDKSGVCQIPDDGIDHMLPEAREWCERYAENQSNDRFVAAAALVRNFGLTNKTATELCDEFGIRTQSDSPEGTSWEKTLDNARKHGEAELGTGVAWQPPPPRDDIPPEIEAALTAAAAANKARFQIRLPSEDKIAPALTFWDGKKLLPTHPSVGFAYGKQGSHKTGLFVKLGLDAVKKGANVLYLAAEGAYGFKTARLPTACDARGMAWDTLDRHWRTVSDTFSLLRPEDHQGLDEALGDFRPNMLFVDVLTRVAAGLDINTPDGSQRIINAAYTLAERFGCPATFAAHPGKDDSRGLMGSYLFEALADFVWRVSLKEGKIFVKVEKLKDGPADRVEVFGVDMSRGAPVVVEAPAEAQPKVGEMDKLAELVKKFLDGDRREFDTKALAAEIAPLQSKAGLCIHDLNRSLRRRAQDGRLTGYVRKDGEGTTCDYKWQKL
jgi:hypothetical protein